MASERLQRRFLIAAAAALFSVSTLTGMAAYRDISTKNGAESLNVMIPGGLRRYRVVAHDNCVGVFEHALDRTDTGFTIRGSGEIRFLLHGTAQTARGTFDAAFNSFGQLGGSLLKLRIGELELRVGSIDIDPIRIKGSLQGPGGTQRIDTSLRGPMVLKQVEAQSYALQYEYLDTLGTLIKGAESQPMLSALMWKFEPTEEADAACTGASAGAIDLTQIAALAEGLVARTNAWTGGR